MHACSGDGRLATALCTRQCCNQCTLGTLECGVPAHSESNDRSGLCLQAALRKAVGERRVQEAYLNVAVGNAPALRLYRRLGFADRSQVDDYYGLVSAVLPHPAGVGCEL